MSAPVSAKGCCLGGRVIGKAFLFIPSRNGRAKFSKNIWVRPEVAWGSSRVFN